uniref:Candidate secreted effector n=1 Tax=Meloidogyne incognita TaxID=6306 RepID=A0A914KJ21_MELIC
MRCTIDRGGLRGVSNTWRRYLIEVSLSVQFHIMLFDRNKIHHTYRKRLKAQTLLNLFISYTSITQSFSN